MGPRPSRLPLVHVALAVTLVLSAVACGGKDDTADKKKAAAPTASSSSSTPGKTYAGYATYQSQQYDGTNHWICHPDLADDSCHDLDITEVKADGTKTVKKVKPATDPPIDCFYAYPTTSDDPAPNADFNVDASEIDTVRAQTAQYATLCRVFAPAYRQVPLVAVTSGDPAARKLAYDDVVDAFKTYMSQQNKGRGFVLIGHSQGAFILQQMITDEIDPKPELRRQLVSALLMGASVAVPEGKDVGGSFKQIPACAKADQVGCVISFMSFPADLPPSADGGSFFGRASGEGMQAMCVNPAELNGGDGSADAILLNKEALIGSAGKLVPDADTPFLALPDVLKSECVHSGELTFLAYSQANTSDTRDVKRLLFETLGPTWGLHLVDANLPQGDLLQIVSKEAKAYNR